MKVKSIWTGSPSICESWLSGVGDDELKRRTWGFVLPRCLPA